MARRILCIGAYANGNLGDMYQADAIARTLKAVDPSIEVTSVSPSKRMSDYPAADHVKGPAGAAFDAAFINGFDALFVGGGGLLAAPHAPLNDPAWVESIRIPMIGVSIGVVTQTAQVSTDFIGKCRAFSVRDEFSRDAVREIRKDAEIVMDPILLDAAVRAPAPAGEGQGIVWVPGKLLPGTEAIWLDVAERLYNSGSDLMISFNPQTDKASGFNYIFGDRVRYLETIDPFLAQISAARLIASERYHGCIYGLAHGRPTLGICLRSRAVTSKIEELYRRLGLEQQIVRKPGAMKRSSLRDLAGGIDMPRVQGILRDEYEVLRGYFTRVLAGL